MFRVGILALALTTAALAQQTVPGTFEPAPSSHVIGSTLPLVSTPTLTLSNGFSPATITLPDTAVEGPSGVVNGGLPQAESGGFLYGSPYAYGPANVETYPSSTAAGAAPVNESATSVDLIGVETHSAYNNLHEGQSLAEQAEQAKQDAKAPVKTFTNDDIDKLNSEEPQTGIISAKFANGQPIVAKNESGFEPASGIANMPGAPDAGTELAQNPMNGQTNAAASDRDQGNDAAQQATTPSTSQPVNANSANQSMPANDNPK